MSTTAPLIGVFDSGVGGLSVLRALRTALPGARFDYLADNAWAPYGERDAAALQGRILEQVREWRAVARLDLLVLACNTATAVAVDALRREHTDLPIVGIEPALKPALQCTRSGQVGVLATRATLQSPRYQLLRANSLAGSRAAVYERAADGLADAIERGDESATKALCRQHLGALLAQAPRLDTLVLGCTHYPLAAATWAAVAGPDIALIDPADAVARRALALLPPHPAEGAGPITLRSTGPGTALGGAAHRWLGLEVAASSIA